MQRKSHSISRQKELRVLNRLGLHARPAAEFVKCVLGYRSAIHIVTEDGRRISADRILEVLTADLSCGVKFAVEAEGVDAEAALERLERLMGELCDKEIDAEG